MGILDSIKDVANKTSEVVSAVVEHESTQAAIAWTKEVAKSDLVKDASAGAAIGAAVAVPVPIIGPAAGAVVGAGLGVFKNLSRQSSEPSKPTALPLEAHKTDLHDELIKLGDLRDKGLLTAEEFDQQKQKLLKLS